MNIIDKANEIAELVMRHEDHELHNKVISLQADIIELNRSKNRLDQLVEDLTKKQSVASRVSFLNGLYLYEAARICPKCWEGSEKIRRLVETQYPGRLACLQCEIVYTNHGGGDYRYHGILAMEQ